jgi:cell wall-associated NlpC family hydrolase
VTKAALAAAMAMALAGCAGSPAKLERPPEIEPAPGASELTIPTGASRLPADARELMIGNAMSMLGQPYRFGGAAPGGFDCSGLVMYAAGGAGIRLPRTAVEQLGSGVPVTRGDLRSGDLVFMHLAHKELHVGIAIDSERFVHAPSKGGHVRIDSLAAPPYSRAYLSARRIIVAR